MAVLCPKCKSENLETAVFCADCGTQLPSVENIKFTKTAETPKEELTTGSIFADRYQIIEELGKGGMGRVYKALHEKFHNDMDRKPLRNYSPFKKSMEPPAQCCNIHHKIGSCWVKID